MTNSGQIAKRAPSVRSRVSNGRRAFIDGDGRGMWARRFRDLTEMHVADLGGREGLSELQLGMCKRIATIECECERMEGQLSQGETVDLDLYNRLSGNLKRLCESIGLERRARDVTPSLDAYVAQRRTATVIEGEPS